MRSPSLGILPVGHRIDVAPLLPAVLAPEDVSQLLSVLPSLRQLSSGGGRGGSSGGFVHDSCVVSTGFVREVQDRLGGVARQAAQEQLHPPAPAGAPAPIPFPPSGGPPPVPLPSAGHLPMHPTPHQKGCGSCTGAEPTSVVRRVYKCGCAGEAVVPADCQLRGNVPPLQEARPAKASLAQRRPLATQILTMTGARVERARRARPARAAEAAARRANRHTLHLPPRASARAARRWVSTT